MTSSQRVSMLIAALALVVLAAGFATAAEPDAEDLQAHANDVDAKTGALEHLEATAEETSAEEEEPSAWADVSASLAVVGEALMTATHVTGQALAATGSAVGNAAVATGSAIATAGAWTAHTIASIAVATADGTAWLALNTAQLAAAGFAALGSGLAWAGYRFADGATWLAAGLAAISTDLANGLVATWPETQKGQAIAASAAGGTAAAGGAAWYTRAWRYLRYAPGLAPLYTRISRDELLDHPARQAIYAKIEQDPGVHLSELSRELDTSWGTLLHHLRKLEKANLVTSEKANGKRCFFLPGEVTDVEQEILPALENEKARSIAEFYAANPGASQSEAAETLELSASLVSWHLQRLEEAGVVHREREGRRQRVGVTQEARAVVAA